MLTGENLYSILFSLPVYQLAFFTILLFNFKKNDNPPGFYLGLLILNIFLFMASITLYFMGYYSFFKIGYIFLIPLLLLTIPFYYLYLNTLTGTINELTNRKLAVLFFPAIIILCINVINVIIIPDSTIQIFILKGFIFTLPNIDSETKFLQQVHILGTGIFITWQLFFLIWKFFNIMLLVKNRDEKNIRQYTYLNSRFVSLLFICIFLFVTFNSALLLFKPELSRSVLFTYNITMLLSTFTIGYLGLKQDTIYKQVIKLTIEENGGHPNTILRQDNPKTNESSYNESIENLKSILAVDKLYLDKNLTIYDLAKKMNIGFRELSHLLNKVMQTNFYGLLNEYRVNEAKELLSRKEYDFYTLEAISDKAGFHSRSSFYACFKKVTGQTPAEYRKNYRRKSF